MCSSYFFHPTLRIFRDQKRVRVLENYCGLSTRTKAQVDRAMQSFIEMLDQDQDYLPAVLGMATGFMIEKNQVSFIVLFCFSIVPIAHNVHSRYRY